MGVEVDGFEVVQAPMEAFTVEEKAALHGKENGKLDQLNESKEPIKFGTHGDEPVSKEGNDDSVANLPKNAADEWPASKRIHYFYFVRHRPHEDPNIKIKIDLADKEIQKKNQSRFQIVEALKGKRSERAEVIFQIKALQEDNKQIRTIVDDKIKEIEPLQQALGKLRSASNTGRGSGLCSSEEELNAIIHSLEYRIQHESIPLTEEKQILREIKQLEGTREKVIANAAVRAKVQDSLVHKEALQDEVKVIGGVLDGVRKQQQEVRGRIKLLEDALKVIDGGIKSLQDELAAVTEKRDKCYETIQQLRKKRDEGNSNFYQSRQILTKARELAAIKDVKGIEELSFCEDEKFMSIWNSNKAFRDDYVLKILPSLDSRQLSRDGRIRNPDEKPLVVVEPTPIKPSETESVAKANSKQTKEDSKSLQLNPAPAPAPGPTQKVQKDPKNKTDELKTSTEQIKKPDPEIYALESPKSAILPKKIEIDPAKLKELKREEEIAKAKLALERKKKLSEKAAAKAAIRAQKDEEKKSKDRVKKAKKKAGASGPATDPPEEQTDNAEETAEPGEVIEKIEPPVSDKEKFRKDNTVRIKNRSRGSDAIRPKIIPKALRKKSTNYWEWAVPCAVLLLAIVVVLGYNYFAVKI